MHRVVTQRQVGREVSNVGTMLTDTLHANSRDIPVIPKKLKIGECHKDMLVFTFRENKSQKKPVLMLSIFAAAGMAEVCTAGGCLKKKPCCIIFYNKYMGDGMDISDHKIYHVSAQCTTRKYWKMIFFNLLDMALLNSYELYFNNTDAIQRKPQKRK